uniref:HA domain-containing protein n=1 Tax=Anisakis simplex TaxID=6269 RepID=A0A0M3JIM8_ANISI
LENTQDADRRSSSNIGFNEQQQETNDELSKNGTEVNGSNGVGTLEEEENGADKDACNEPTKECIRVWAARHNFDPQTLFHKV